MLDFIKRYRASEDRTVITLKMHDCLCFNKLGDLNTAKEAKNEQNEAQKPSQAKEKDKKGKAEKESARAFKEEEHITWLDDELNAQNDCNCASEKEFCMPCGMIDLKGGINCEKTIRVLLCDVICGSMVMLGALGVAKLINCKLK